MDLKSAGAEELWGVDSSSRHHQSSHRVGESAFIITSHARHAQVLHPACSDYVTVSREAGTVWYFRASVFNTMRYGRSNIRTRLVMVAAQEQRRLIVSSYLLLTRRSSLSWRRCGYIRKIGRRVRLGQRGWIRLRSGELHGLPRLQQMQNCRI